METLTNGSSRARTENRIRKMLMKKPYSVKTYRAIDLTLFSLILFVFESVIVRVSSSPIFRDQAFSVSLAAAVTTIVFFRWGYWGGIHAALSGVVWCVMGGGTWTQMIVYVVGNLFSLFAVPLIRRTGPDRILSGKWIYLAFGLGTILLMQFGRAAVAVVFGVSLTEAFRFFTTDSLSVVFTLVILWIAHRLDGMCEDQRRYLKRISHETEE